jgi:hypothetical protein
MASAAYNCFMLVAFALTVSVLGLVSTGLGLRARRLFLRRIAELDREMSTIRGFMTEEMKREPPRLDIDQLN